MSTRQEIVAFALEEIGVSSADEAPTAEDYTKGSRFLDAAFAEFVEAASIPLDRQVGMRGGVGGNARVERTPATTVVPSQSLERNPHAHPPSRRLRVRSCAGVSSGYEGIFTYASNFFTC